VTEHEVAWAAWQWSLGVRQNALARQFGHKNPSYLSIKISRFVHRYAGRASRDRWGRLAVQNTSRKELVPEALAEFQRRHGIEKLRIRLLGKK
jgi:hypothetical protein